MHATSLDKKQSLRLVIQRLSIMWAIIFFRRGGSQIYWGVINFWKEKYGEGGHKICDDQNVGSHKMTTDGMFILFKKTDFNTILGVSVVGVMKFLLQK